MGDINGQNVTSENWSLLANTRINAEIAANPNLPNGVQLGIMNAYKEAAGVVDAASPFTIGADGGVTALHQLPDWATLPVIGPVATWIADGSIAAGNKITAAKDSIFASVSDFVGAATYIPPEIEYAFVALAAIAGIAAIGYTLRAFK